MSTNTPKKDPCLVVTAKVRLSYAHIWTPQAAQEGGEPKYSLSIIIPKSDKATIKAIEEATKAAAELGKAKLGGKIPATLKVPLRDGDAEREDDEAYLNSLFLNASSKSKPQIVDADVNPILDQDQVYSGCYARVSLRFYAYNSNGSKGVAAGLGNIQKLADGEPLGGKRSAEADFGAFKSEEDDDL